MNKILILLLTVFAVFFWGSPSVYAAEETPDYLELRSIDAGTFNEYRYLMWQKYLELKRGFTVDNSMKKEVLEDIAVIATTGKNYLPENLTNENLYNNLVISLAKGAKQPSNANNFTAISGALQAFLESTDIPSIIGEINITPNEWNAPLNTSLRAQVSDPSGSRLDTYNYTWWIDRAGKRTIIWNGPSLNYTFSNEGIFGVFLDVTSNHVNKGGYTDVLPLRQKVVVTVNEKIASVILNVNNNKVFNRGVIKVSPSEAEYGIIFDATSSTPSNSSQFARTIWDFWNGVKREYAGGPRVERVKYSSKDPQTVTLTLVTNEWISITRQFNIIITQPIAEIKASSGEGFLGDKFSFSAKGSDKFEWLNYNWEIVDIERESIIYKKSGTSFSYIFPNKGRYNVKLNVWNGKNTDVDNKTIYINSRPPIADFIATIPNTNQPNRIQLDGTRSYDPDFSDDGRLEYAWIIDWERAVLEDGNSNNSLGYYTFNSIGNHSVVLAVLDPDNISNQKQSKVQISSTLSLDFIINPSVIQRNNSATFTATSDQAVSFAWDFGDWVTKNSASNTIKHTYQKSWVYNVKLTVRDTDNNMNTQIKNIYVWDANSPYAKAIVKNKNNSSIEYRANSCSWESAYIVNKVDAVQFSGAQSIDVDGLTSGLEYSWKIGNNNYFSTKDVSYGFDEVWCVPIKLTVKSSNNGSSDSETIYVKVENLKPTLDSLNIQVVDESTDPVIVNVSARGAQDRDGIIQSYLWYYYTDSDSEPQDFKSTVQPQTTFVLPKITGNYYFVVVLKDSNEQRVNSEEATGEKFYITLAWDNLNTPLIKLQVSDSSVALWEEVIYTAQVENILGQDISWDVEYAWDFDGDGFYEKQSKTSTMSHSFTQSGEFYSKVKVKNKGFSNVRTVTINVANKIQADFDYISIGEKIIFINTSRGEIDSAKWNLWDGSTSEALSTFTHVYSDGNKTHDVTLEIMEGSQKKEVTKTVQWNPRNILESRKPWLNIFSYPGITEDTMQLTSLSDNVYVYLAESEDTIAYFAIDYDVEYDSDLNGGKADDEDNKAFGSYNTGAPAQIELNDARIQNVAIIGKNENGATLEVYNLEIIKLYIPEFSDTDTQEDENNIIFEWVSDDEKVKIEKLKAHLIQLSQDQRVKAMRYLAKLQEEWFDHTEKTRVIIEFEQYIDSTGYTNSAEVIEILESLLVAGQEQKDDAAITYNALKNLIPDDISCETWNDQDCKSYLVAKLDAIPNTNSAEEKTQIWSEIWDVIKADSSMTDQQKRDFGAILKTYTYGGVENIPVEEGGIDEPELNEDSAKSGGFMNAIKTLFKWIVIIIFVIIVLISLFWIFYKLKNKDHNIGFQDYIIDKTKNDDSDPLTVVESQKKDVIIADPLSEKTETKDVSVAKNKDIKKEEKVATVVDAGDGAIPSWLAGASAVSDSSSKSVAKEEKIEQKIDKNKSQKPIEKPVDKKAVEKIEVKPLDEKVPDWLQQDSSNNELKASDVESENKKPENKKPENKKPGDQKIDQTSKEKPVENKKDALGEKQELDELTAIESDKKSDDSNIPDWLKWAVDETPSKKTQDKPSDSKITPNTEDKKIDKKTPEDKSKTENKKPDKNDDLPDWLKGSMDEAPTKDDKVDDKKTSSKDNTSDKKESTDKKSTDKKPEDKKVDKKFDDTKKPSTTKPDAKKSTPDKKSSKKDIAKDDSKESKDKKSELWDDGMDVPDWLKWSDDK